MLTNQLVHCSFLFCQGAFSIIVENFKGSFAALLPARHAPLHCHRSLGSISLCSFCAIHGCDSLTLQPGDTLLMIQLHITHHLSTATTSICSTLTRIHLRARCPVSRLCRMLSGGCDGGIPGSCKKCGGGELYLGWMGSV